MAYSWLYVILIEERKRREWTLGVHHLKVTEEHHSDWKLSFTQHQNINNPNYEMDL